MTIEQLQYFYAITQFGTFSEAAIQLNISQSALSKQIAKLESELQSLLFDRSHRQIALTKAGELLQKDVLPLLNNYATMRQNLADHQQQETSRLSIAIAPIFSYYDLSKQLAQYRKRYPLVHLDIHEIEERDLSLPEGGNYDLYILREYDDFPQGYHSLPLFKDRLIALLSDKHPLAQAKQVSLASLTHDKLLLPPAYTAISRTALQACKAAGFTPTHCRHGRLETLISAAQEQEGVALLMEKSLQVFHLKHLNVLPLEETITADIHLYYAAEAALNPTVKTFIRFLKDQRGS